MGSCAVTVGKTSKNVNNNNKVTLMNECFNVYLLRYKKGCVCVFDLAAARCVYTGIVPV
jgi:hypothetical protein